MRVFWRRQLVTASLLCGATVLSGCPGSRTVPQGYVVRAWANNMRELGIVPVFPPREDVQIGDMYVYTFDPESAEAEAALAKGDRRIGVTPRWNSISVLALLRTQYQARPSWPPTPSDYPSPVATGSPSQPHQPGTTPIFGRQPTTHVAGTDGGRSGTGQPAGVFDGEDVPNRLRLVGFPEFLAATFVGGDVNALVPIEAVNLAFGASWADAKAVTVKVPTAESYSLPVAELLAQVLEEIPRAERRKAENGKRAPPTARLKEPFRAFLPSSDVSEDKHPAVWVRIVSEVFYARAMDIGIQAQTTAGGRAEGRLGPALSTAASGGETTSAGDQPPNAYRRAEQLNTALRRTANAQSLPGGSISFVTATDRSIGMRRIWERNIAIGFRGVVLQVDQSSEHQGDVLNISVPRSAVTR